MYQEMTTVLEPAPLPDFVETAFVKTLSDLSLIHISEPTRPY